MEQWKDIEGYERLYQASNYGNVKSLNYNRTGKEKLLKPGVDGCGYLFVRLYKDGKAKQPRIHQLIAQTFIPNPLNLPQVNHKDENKTNNKVWINDDGTVDLEKSNLEWCTHEYNINYGTRNQRSAEAHTNGIASKKVYQYTLEGELVKIWSSTNECGRNGYNQGAVAACCKNKFNKEGNNKYKGYIWSYVPL